MRCKDLHQNKTLIVGLERAGSTTREQQVFSAPILKYVLGIISLWLAESLMQRPVLNRHRQGKSVTKLCPIGRRTQPLTPTNTQTISLPGHHFSFPPFLYFPSDDDPIIYLLYLASDRQSLVFYRCPVAWQYTRSCHTSKNHRIKIYICRWVSFNSLKLNAQI